MLAARTGLSPVMVGRADELARLRELAITTGEPAVALISAHHSQQSRILLADGLSNGEIAASTSPPRPPRCTSPTSWPSST
jgi:uncharacterized membrane protein